MSPPASSSGTDASEERYRRVVETTHEGVFIMDEGSRIVFANGRLYDMLGYAHGELLGRDVLALMHWPGEAKETAGEGPRTVTGEHEVALNHKAGGIVWALVRGTPMVDERGNPSGVLAMFSDITERRRTEDLLRRSEARFRALVEHASDVVAILDPKGRILYESPAMRRLVGVRSTGYPSDDSFAEVHPDDLAQVASDFQSLTEGRHQSVPLACRFKHTDGTWHYAEGVGTNLLHEPAVEGIVLNFRDVTERRLAEENAQEAAKRIERLTADAVYSIDRSGRLHSWNHGAEQLFGWTKEEALGQQLPMVPEAFQARARTDVQGIMDKGNTISKETVRLAKDGREIEVLGSWSPVHLEDGSTGVLCILKDITAHKQAHTQLQEQARALTLLRERERIAMDLHDGVIQSLYGVALNLGALRRSRAQRRLEAEDPEAILRQAVKQLTDTIQGIRDYIYDLRAGIPEDGNLTDGLRSLSDEFVKSGIRPGLHLEANAGDLGHGVVSHLLYITREALSNVVRHAEATDVDILLLPTEPGGLVLTIADNGRGFEPDNRGRRAGDGLNNMRQRARLIGAQLNVDSRLGSGTIVSVRIP